MEQHTTIAALKQVQFVTKTDCFRLVLADAKGADHRFVCDDVTFRHLASQITECLMWADHERGKFAAPGGVEKFHVIDCSRFDIYVTPEQKLGLLFQFAQNPPLAIRLSPDTLPGLLEGLRKVQEHFQKQNI